MSSAAGDSTGADDLGLNEHHQSQLSRYLRFARLQRDKRLRTVDAAFEDCMLSRLSEVTYTRDEVEELLTLLSGTVHDEVRAELVNADHTALLLLRQLFVQAQQWHLRLDSHVEQLENKELMDLVKTFEEDELAGKTRGKVCLAPLNDDKALTELLKLGDEKSKLIERIQSIEAQASTLASEKGELSSELVKLRSELEFLKTSKDTVSKEQLDQIRDQASSVQRELEANLQQSEFTKTLLADELDTTKHKLEEIRSQLELAEQELDHKFQQTAAYRNMKKMLMDKNAKLKDLRSKLSKYEKDDTVEEE
ncbi:leucine zipper transcription factor-like protein 1 [Amphibalanus amphitrite]|uniref:leucine zipper transcription factor-like protein 1 n=1 Tax=Amphibalanus amphitrite TaxID=1232801 RepID=UPI001C9159D6|nr:leucine zipper transcription factor-like protein 1 [Amphibalanus amphitrite]